MAGDSASGEHRVLQDESPPRGEHVCTRCSKCISDKTMIRPKPGPMQPVMSPHSLEPPRRLLRSAARVCRECRLGRYLRHHEALKERHLHHQRELFFVCRQHSTKEAGTAGGDPWMLQAVMDGSTQIGWRMGRLMLRVQQCFPTPGDLSPLSQCRSRRELVWTT